MLPMTNYLHDYVIENAKFFNEFDRSSFITNASYALNDKVVDMSVSIKGNQYSHILEKTMSHINEITIDTYAVSEFVSNILNSAKVDAANIQIPDISKADIISLKPQYLTEAINNYREVINNIVTGKYGADNIKGLYNSVDAYITTLKKRLVSTNITIDFTPKAILNQSSLRDTTQLTTKYLEDVVLPFLQDVPKKKKDLISELSGINFIINSSVGELKRVTSELTSAMVSNEIEENKRTHILSYSYNYIRAIMEAMSYVTYAAMRKVHQFEESVVVCQNIYNKLILLFNDASTVVEAGVFDKKVITATDANNMAEKLVDGDNDVFAELSHNIMEYHKGYIASNVSLANDISGEDAENHLSNILSNTNYKRGIYNDIVKAYIEIGNGLDIIAKNCDDRLAIFDELVKKAGFVIALHERFHNEIEALEDLSNYAITDLALDNNQKSDVYFTILTEINDYADLTSQIAKAAKVIYTKADYIEDLFNRKSNGELAYSETMNELKIFLDSFKDQYRKLNCDIVKGLYYRIKSLAAKADDCLDNVYSTPESDLYTDDDFFKEAVLANLEEIDAINDIVMEALLSKYYSEREFKERGVRLIYEAEGQSPDTSVKITDNNNSVTTTNSTTNPSKIREGISNLLKSIGEWFTKMINAFNELIGREKTKNLKWLAEHKDGLTTRSYSNVEIQILPYNNMPSNKVVEDIAKMTSNVNAMTVQNIAKVNSYEDLRAKLINFGPKFNDNDEKVTITNYYKIGNNAVKTVPIANNNIKTMVVNDMIPYCEQFYDNYKTSIETQLTSLKNAITEINKTYVNECVNDIAELTVFLEADARPAQQTQTAQTQNTDNTSTTGLSTKASWMKQCTQNYSGSVLNAIRDRKNDYFKVLFALAPKTVNKPTEPQQQPAANVK